MIEAVQSVVRRLRARGRENELLAELDELVCGDPLTGLPDRGAWQFELDRDLAGASRTGAWVSIALMDIDNFTTINEAVGHPGGDLLLRSMAHHWLRTLRPEDVIARVGADEFAVLISGCSYADAIGVIKRLRSQLPWPHTCSVGLATWDTREHADQLIARAEHALHDAQRVSGPPRSDFGSAAGHQRIVDERDHVRAVGG